jgi:hypothetical protein
MRTLLEIISAVRDGETPDQDELRLALLAMDHMLDATMQLLINNAEQEVLAIKQPGPHYLALQEFLRRNAQACRTAPDAWLGWDNHPDNPDFQERRQHALAVVKKQLH